MHRSWIAHGALPRTGKKRVVCALLKTPKIRGHSYKVPRPYQIYQAGKGAEIALQKELNEQGLA